MSLFGKVDIEVAIQASAHSFHEVHSKRLPEAPSLCPDWLQRVDLVEGEWGELGSVMEWYFVFDGNAVLSKEVFEAKDDENLSVTFKVIGGLLMEEYKSFKFIIQATPKDEGDLVHWTLEYEKLNADVPDPNLMLHFAANVTKAIDAHLTQSE